MSGREVNRAEPPAGAQEPGAKDTFPQGATATDKDPDAQLSGASVTDVETSQKFPKSQPVESEAAGDLEPPSDSAGTQRRRDPPEPQQEVPQSMSAPSGAQKNAPTEEDASVNNAAPAGARDVDAGAPAPESGATRGEPNGVQESGSTGTTASLVPKPSRTDVTVVGVPEAESSDQSQESVVTHGNTSSSGLCGRCSEYRDEEDCDDFPVSLQFAAKHGLCCWVKAHIAAGADVNVKDSHHFTPLIEAVSGWHVKCVEVLVEAGADVNQCECEGGTPLMFACSHGLLECVRILIGAGADVNRYANFRKTALMNATWNGHLDCVEALLSAGADVNFVSSYGHTAVTGKYKSSSRTDYECLQLLLDSGADVNAPDRGGFNSGREALCLAVAEPDVNKVRMYLNAGLRINEHSLQNQGVLQMIFPDIVEEVDEMYRQVALFLYAAGERMDGSTRSGDSETFLEFVGLSDVKLWLKHLCREAIREHLIELEPAAHLFQRIPRLGLPPSVTDYLLFYQTLLVDLDTFGSEPDTKADS